MKAIALKIKQYDPNNPSVLVVFDEYIQGNITGEWFVPVFTGAAIGMKFYPLSYLILHYKFPEREGKPTAKMMYGYAGAYPDLAENVQWYEEDTITV